MTSQQEVYYPLPHATGEVSAETKRLDDQHEMFKLLLGSISSAPVRDDISDVLDLGCGTGIWCRQFAELHPSAKVLGVDIVPPSSSSIANSDTPTPKNCTFEQGDIEGVWQFAESRSFDFIFARLLIVAVRNWRRLFERAYSSLRPGGMLELLEGCMMFSADDEAGAQDSAMSRWWGALRDLNEAKGVKPGTPLIFNELLQDCGFEVIEDKPVKLYMSPEAALQHGIRNGEQVAAQASSDCRAMVTNVTGKILTTDAHRALAAEALEDLAENSGRRGYYMLCLNKVARKAIH